MASVLQVVVAPAKRSWSVLRPTSDGDGEHVDHEVLVDVAQDAQGVLVGVLLGGVGGMALLPQELGGPQEQPGPQFPAHHVGPLVQQQGQVTVALDPLGQERVDDRLAGGPDDDRLLQLLAATVGDHRQLGAETLNVLGLAPEVALGDEQREVGVLRPRRLDAGVDLGLHALPDGVAVRPDDDRAPDRAALGQFRLGQDVLVPLGEIVRLGGEDVGFGHSGRC